MKKIIKYTIIGGVCGGGILPVSDILCAGFTPGYVGFYPSKGFIEDFKELAFLGLLVGGTTGFLWALWSIFKEWLDKPIWESQNKKGDGLNNEKE